MKRTLFWTTKESKKPYHTKFNGSFIKEQKMICVENDQISQGSKSNLNFDIAEQTKLINVSVIWGLIHKLYSLSFKKSPILSW